MKKIWGFRDAGREWVPRMTPSVTVAVLMDHVATPAPCKEGAGSRGSHTFQEIVKEKKKN
jgi:hypothetical protein